MNGVYLARTGLACALGNDLLTSIATLQLGGVPPALVRIAENGGFENGPWPVFKLPREEGAWLQRVQDTVRSVAAQTGDWGDRTAPLFVASSSLDIGGMEEATPDLRLGGDLQDFADVIASALEWQGPVFTVSTACTSAFNAVLAAAELLQAGEASEALVIGAEFENRFTLAGFGSMQLLAPDPAQPFGATRKGVVLGEAVAALRLSSELSRWRIHGGANVVEGSNPSGTEDSAVRAVCSASVANAGLQLADVDLIKVMAAGSPVNDAIEVHALKGIFDPLPPLVSFKSFLGHTLGAAGAAELALLVGCIEENAWPTTGYVLDETLGISFSDEAPTKLRYILFNQVGFGGGHASLLIEDCQARVTVRSL